MTRTPGADSNGVSAKEWAARYLRSGRLSDADPAWKPDPKDSPAAIAVLNLQWRLVRAMESRLGARCGNRLAQLIGDKPRQVQKKLSGESAIQLEDVLRWCLATDLDIRELFDGPGAELLPAPWRRLAVHWTNPPNQVPAFLTPDPSDEWRVIFHEVGRLWRQDCTTSCAHLLDEGTLRHYSASAAISFGIDANHLIKGDNSTGPCVLTVTGPTPASVYAIHWPDSPESAWSSHSARLHAAIAEASPKRAIFVLVSIGRRASKQLDHWSLHPDRLKPEDTVVVAGIEILRRRGVPSTPDIEDITLQVLGVERAQDFNLLMLSAK